MNKQKIAILSFWNVPNFGTFLQSYALVKVLQNMYPDYDVRLIPHVEDKHLQVYYKIARPVVYPYAYINPLFYKDTIARVKNKKQIEDLSKFKNYYKEFLPYFDVNDENLCENVFDTLVLGSDIIWSYDVRFFNNDSLLFGIGVNAKNKISYAASFGTVKRTNKHPDYVIDGIKSLNAISVRDENSSEIVGDIVGKNAEVVLDPTLLYDFGNDLNIKAPNVDYKYVIVYGSYFTQDQIVGLKKYCAEKSLKIICLDTGLDKCDWCDVFVDASNITPFQWCGYIKNSEFIMTSTFHGFMFGLIFKRKIIFNATSFMKAKMSDLLHQLDLYDYLVDRTFSQQISYSWDYEKIDKIISAKRIKSFQFLERNIH